MNKYWTYFKYVCLHKWYVLVECIPLEIYWRGLVHDLSKFRPSEFIPYARWFYGRPDEKANPFEYKKVKRAYEYAWLQHINRNSHHWQGYILGFRDGKLDIFEMPMVDRKEMLADWRGMTWVLNPKISPRKASELTLKWYLDNKDKMRLGEETRVWIEWELCL
jgi:hypothetical protein